MLTKQIECVGYFFFLLINSVMYLIIRTPKMNPQAISNASITFIIVDICNKNRAVQEKKWYWFRISLLFFCYYFRDFSSNKVEHSLHKVALKSLYNLTSESDELQLYFRNLHCSFTNFSFVGLISYFLEISQSFLIWLMIPNLINGFSKYGSKHSIDF